MSAYLVRRLLLVPPTLFGIMIINFVVVQFAPGGPVEQMLATLQGRGDVLSRVTGAPGDLPASPGAGTGETTSYRGAQGLDPQLVARIERLFGFDKPAHERFLLMIGNYLRFDFGESYFHGRDVIDLIIDKLPVSVSLGVWSTLIIYTVSIPLGILKATRDGTRLDVVSSAIIIVASAIPAYLAALLLIVLFAGGSFFSWFPLQGLASAGSADMSLAERIADYAWHMVLPVTAMTIGGFASLTLLVKNAFIEEISRLYVMAARARGLSDRRILYGHVFRNAMLIVIAGLPAAIAGMFFGSSLMIEVLFSLDGLGLLGFESAVKRDYPVVFGTLYIFTLLGLLLHIASDLLYAVIDPRIDFEARGS